MTTAITTGTRDIGGSSGKRALLIGIDHYPNLQAFCRANAMPNDCQLAGCANDAELLAGILRDKFGFTPGAITLLRNEDATQAAILAAMANLLDATQPNDVVVFHYSGHGSQAAAALPGSESDSMDETIVPSDSGRGNLPNRDIRDGQIHDWLTKLTAKTPYVTLIVDACHSGSITRDLFGGAGRWVAADPRPPAPEAVAAAQAAQANAAQAGTAASATGSRDLGPSGWLPLGSKYVLFAGCLDEEKSNEHPHDSTTNGALTYFLSRQLLLAGPGTTYRDVYEPAATQVTAKYTRQHPQLEGARDRALFGVHDIAPMTFARVTARTGLNVTIAAGVAHGATVGSRWALYPQGTKTLAAGVVPQGEILLTAVRATTSDGTLTNAVAPVAVDSRAVEVLHAPGDVGLRVEIQADAADAAALTAALATAPLVHLAQPGQTADARAYLLAPRFAAQPGHDPVPQLGALAQPTWAVVGSDGQLLMPPHAAGAPGVADLLVSNLANLAKYRQTLALQNPDSASALKGKVGFTLKRQADGGWTELAAPTGGLPEIAEGDRISLTVKNGWNKPIYLSILDLGVTGSISLLYPVTGASEALLPGGTLNIGMSSGEYIELVAPDEFHFQMNPADPHTMTGTEVFKLIATANPTDFSALVQPGFRDLDPTTPGAGTPLMNLLMSALLGTGSRDARVVRAAPAEEWTTVDRPFLFRASGST